MAILFRPQYVKVQLGLQQSSYNYLLCHVESIVIKSAVVAFFFNMNIAIWKLQNIQASSLRTEQNG